jgi:hypothetical protein
MFPCATTWETTMRRVLATFFLLASGGIVAIAPDQVRAATEAPTREALLKAAVARDRGEITAMEPSSREGGGVIIGHSSGAVLNCYRDRSCREFLGTPNTTVGHIAVSRQDDAEVVWVSYPQGALYRCIGNRCEKFLWDGLQDQ